MKSSFIPAISIKIMESKTIIYNFHGNYSCESLNKELTGQFEAKIIDNQLIIESNNNLFISQNEVIEFKPVAENRNYFQLNNVTIGVDFHWQQFENQQFRGALKLMVVDDKIVAINILDVENYLKCVIASEMRGDSSLELLKAHAVVSRSWLFAQIEKQKEIDREKYQSMTKTDTEYIRWYDREDHVLFDVCADDHCQRYQGITKSSNPNVELAINQTNGQVLMYKGSVCDTRYSKSCGGHTETFANVWEPVQHPYLKQIVDYQHQIKEVDLKNEKNATSWIESQPEAFCNTKDQGILSQVLNDYDQNSKDFYRWEISYEQNELAQLIKNKSGIDFGEIIDLEPIERGNSSRLVKLKIVGTKRTLTVGKELEIRRWLSTSHLYSSAFIVYKKDLTNGIPSKFVLKGAGWGHGVGLCQIGAAVMSHRGYSYNEILKHYFTDTELVEKY